MVIRHKGMKLMDERYKQIDKCKHCDEFLYKIGNKCEHCKEERIEYFHDLAKKYVYTPANKPGSHWADEGFWPRYADYLRSHAWKEKRGKVLRRDGYVCQACLNNEAHQVHHLNYKHWGNEPLFDLISVCKPCHDKITDMDRNGNPGYVGELEY